MRKVCGVVVEFGWFVVEIIGLVVGMGIGLMVIFARVLHGFLRICCGFEQSVQGAVLHGFHTPNNNVFLKSYLVIVGGV